MATVGVSASGSVGGAPGRAGVRVRPSTDATAGCSSLGEGGTSEDGGRWAARLRGIRFCARAVRLLGNAEDCGARICCRLGFGRGTRLLVAPRAVGGIEPGASSADGRAIAEARQLHELRRLALILFGRGAKARRGLRVAVKARSKEERVGRIGLLRDRLPGREQQQRHDACAQYWAHTPTLPLKGGGRQHLPRPCAGANAAGWGSGSREVFFGIMAVSCPPPGSLCSPTSPL